MTLKRVIAVSNEETALPNESFIIPEYNLPIPNVLYKFLHSSDVHYLKELCTIRICSNEFYRQRYYEMEVKNPFIYDPHEGVEATVQKKAFNFSNATENEMRNLRIIFPGAHGTGGHIENNVIQYVLPSFHMMCFTSGEPHEIASVFTRQYGDIPPYDACIKFSRIPELFCRICEEGLLYIDNENKFDHFSDVFDLIGLKNVNYVDKVRGWSDEFVEPSEFNKDITFVEQKEYRFIFSSSRYAGTLAPVLTCKVPNLGEFIEVIKL